MYVQCSTRLLIAKYIVLKYVFYIRVAFLSIPAISVPPVDLIRIIAQGLWQLLKEVDPLDETVSRFIVEGGGRGDVRARNPGAEITCLPLATEK